MTPVTGRGTLNSGAQQRARTERGSLVLHVSRISNAVGAKEMDGLVFSVSKVEMHNTLMDFVKTGLCQDRVTKK